MAYPPATLPSNRTDATPQATNHPNDHNKIAQALTDIVNELGNNPSDGSKTVQSRLNDLEADAVVQDMAGNQTMIGSLTATQMYVTDPPAGPNALTNKAYVDGDGTTRVMSGNLQVGGNPASPDYNNGSQVLSNGHINATTNTGGGNVWINRVGGANVTGQQFIEFVRSNTTIGSVRIASSSSVSYDTTSDHRLKQSEGPVQDPAGRIKSLAALAFQGRWIADEGAGQSWDMLYAHDIDTVAPYAVHGAKDAVDGEGQPAYQTVDYSSLVPLLVAALGDALTRIEQLEAQ